MHAERLLIETDDQGKPIHLPQLPPNCRLEAIFLFPEQPPVPAIRHPSPAIAGKGGILGDIMTPIIPDSDWDILR